jgi:hypothetical protein
MVAMKDVKMGWLTSSITRRYRKQPSSPNSNNSLTSHSFLEAFIGGKPCAHPIGWEEKENIRILSLESREYLTVVWFT